MSSRVGYNTNKYEHSLQGSEWENDACRARPKKLGPVLIGTWGMTEMTTGSIAETASPVSPAADEYASVSLIRSAPTAGPPPACWRGLADTRPGGASASRKGVAWVLCVGGAVRHVNISPFPLDSAVPRLLACGWRQTKACVFRRRPIPAPDTPTSEEEAT